MTRKMKLKQIRFLSQPITGPQVTTYVTNFSSADVPNCAEQPAVVSLVDEATDHIIMRLHITPSWTNTSPRKHTHHAPACRTFTSYTTHYTNQIQIFFRNSTWTE
jgi:hypothetical protein